jgi:hypothetical protein
MSEALRVNLDLPHLPPTSPLAIAATLARQDREGSKDNVSHYNSRAVSIKTIAQLEPRRSDFYHNLPLPYPR